MYDCRNLQAQQMRTPLAVMAAGIQLMRPFNCVMSAAGVGLGAWAAVGRAALPSPLKLACAMACGALITAGGNTINDCFDAQIDRINHPQRPIPSGRVTKSAACVLAALELVAGVALGGMANITCGMLALLAVALLAAYEAAGLKNAGLPGNIVISLLTGLLFVTGGAAAGDFYRPGSLVLLAFLASMGREIVKDIEDIAGDAPRRTWPMRVGIGPARRGAAAFFVAAVLLSPLPWWLGTSSAWYLVAVALADLLFVRAIFVLFGQAGGAARAAKQAMFAVLAAFLAGVLL